MMKTTNLPSGHLRCDDVEACLSVRGEDLIVRGGVVLRAVQARGNYADAWIEGLRLDAPGQPEWSGALADDDEELAHDALFAAAVDELRRVA